MKPAKKFFKNNLHHHSNAVILGTPMERLIQEDKHNPNGNPHSNYIYMHQRINKDPLKSSEPETASYKF